VPRADVPCEWPLPREPSQVVACSLFTAAARLYCRLQAELDREAEVGGRRGCASISACVATASRAERPAGGLVCHGPCPLPIAPSRCPLHARVAWAPAMPAPAPLPWHSAGPARVFPSYLPAPPHDCVKGAVLTLLPSASSPRQLLGMVKAMKETGAKLFTFTQARSRRPNHPRWHFCPFHTRLTRDVDDTFLPFSLYPHRLSARRCNGCKRCRRPWRAASTAWMEPSRSSTTFRLGLI
jgi:hypothetical protein